MKYKFIDSDAQLKITCDELSCESIIGVDLEADSLHCFREKICLIQVAAKNRAFLVDPFGISDMSPLRRVLENPDIIKVFHGSDFDVRSLDRDYGARVVKLFDTEIACRFLGIRERGLAALLKRNFNLDVDKKFQKINWAQRPLKQEMIEYSVGDVSHLVQLYDIICKALAEKNRLDWAWEESAIQAQVEYEDNHARPLFKKIKGAGRMDPRTLAVLENLLEMRICIAEKKNRPLFKIISNSALVTLARNKPLNHEHLVKSSALSRKQVSMYGNLCLDAIAKAMSIKDDDLPSYPRRGRYRRKDSLVLERIKELRQMREKLSRSMGMEPGFLLNNTMIDTLAFKNPATIDQLGSIDNIRHWQVESMGACILATLGRCRA